jgi:adenylate cyclase
MLRALDIGIVPESRLRVFDIEERLWPRSSDPARVAIVDIDERSLAQYGQWPWPRTQVAKLVRRIAEGHPRVLGIDIVFAERDRLSPPEIVRELPDLPASLAEGLAQLPPSEWELAEGCARFRRYWRSSPAVRIRHPLRTPCIPPRSDRQAAIPPPF